MLPICTEIESWQRFIDKAREVGSDIKMKRTPATAPMEGGFAASIELECEFDFEEDAVVSPTRLCRWIYRKTVLASLMADGQLGFDHPALQDMKRVPVPDGIKFVRGSRIV